MTSVELYFCECVVKKTTRICRDHMLSIKRPTDIDSIKDGPQRTDEFKVASTIRRQLETALC